MLTKRSKSPGDHDRGRRSNAIRHPSRDDSMEAVIGGRVSPRSDGCWIWTGPVNPQGYGHHGPMLVHRFVWETLRGPIPAGMVVHHRCETPPCCNPEHLELMTRSDHSSMHARQQHAPLT